MKPCTCFQCEELCSVACSVQNIHLAATHLGVGLYWSTGGVYSPPCPPVLLSSQSSDASGTVLLPVGQAAPEQPTPPEHPAGLLPLPSLAAEDPPPPTAGGGGQAAAEQPGPTRHAARERTGTPSLVENPAALRAFLAMASREACVGFLYVGEVAAGRWPTTATRRELRVDFFY